MLWGAPAWSEDRPRVAIIIDDLGNALAAGRAALALPGPVTYAFLPHRPHTRRLATQAHISGKEVMLHLPMQSQSPASLGPGALTRDMDRAHGVQTLSDALASVPHAAGVNNHMGSLLTQDPGAMQWVMDTLRERGLYFVDSRTTAQTVAELMAAENTVAVARRNVFLDADPRPGAVRAEFDRLVYLARRDGSAVGIGHPHADTLAVLAEEIPRLPRLGVYLVPASRLTKTYQRKRLWHASSSHLPKVAKSSKP
jgi:hypothetical protein